jgi:hypothetical protein
MRRVRRKSPIEWSARSVTDLVTSNRATCLGRAESPIRWDVSDIELGSPESRRGLKDWHLLSGRFRQALAFKQMMRSIW